MRIWLGDGTKFYVNVDMTIIFCFIEDGVIANINDVKFPPGQVAFNATHIRMEFYGVIELNGGFVKAGDGVIITQGKLKIRMLRNGT